MRKQLLAIAASVLMLLCPGSAAAESQSDTVLPEPPAGFEVSYLESLTVGPKKRDLPKDHERLNYWYATWRFLPMTGDFRKDLITIARSQIGYRESRTDTIFHWQDGLKGYTRYGEWFGRTYGYWCDMFVSFCLHYAGKDDYPREQSCMRHELLLKKAGLWRDWNTYIPKTGDIVFYNLNAKPDIVSHCGIVEMVVPATTFAPARLITIEGNVYSSEASTNSVQRMIRTFDDVAGYGVYEVGPAMPERSTTRCDSYANGGYTYSAPSWDVLTFIGAAGSNYAKANFPDRFRP